METKKEKPILKVTMSKSDCEEVASGEVMRLTWQADTGLEVDLIIGLEAMCDYCCIDLLDKDLVETKDGDWVCVKCKKQGK